MRVHQLIKILEAFNQDLEVCVTVPELIEDSDKLSGYDVERCNVVFDDNGIAQLVIEGE